MLSELTATRRRLALVGLAKNTGKTVALAALLRELGERGRAVGVTSVGRDGERHDVIDARIEKPSVQLPAGSLVATTDVLLRASGLPHEILEETDMRTPLGQVLVARLRGTGAIELAGPSVAAGVRRVSDAMLANGAQQVLIDGAVDRRAASSPDVADGLVMSTGAVLDHDMAAVVSQTRDAVELVRLPGADDGSPGASRLQELTAVAPEDREAPDAGRSSMLVGEDLEVVTLPRRFVLTSDGEQIAHVLDANPTARWLTVPGAVPERFLRNLVHPVQRRRRELVVVVLDPTKVFLWKRGPEWYRRQGIHLQTLKQIQLEALTVNPIAPRSHRFDSAELRALLRESIPELAIFDVLDPDYTGERLPAPAL
ncbi:MAG: hypothetical protein ACRDJX_09510 [Solirubrobacteraceae bacterium]